ncbi:uncharacterized protein LOC110039051 [Phalaenopsis equestris]|uniref:uncharacterized protein LOC110039051 n=1 Tax=Phalaenopsis equestris TaxID=78828 RepID=UPI0009E32BBA|nr:uncharacterized protein LOC110039051 [Phalaenopsis equestris]
MNVNCIQEEFFAQKAAKTRFCEGDRNSKCFHACIKFRIKCNTIHKIKETDGKWLHSDDLIAARAVNYYQTLFKQPSALRPTIQQDLFYRDENFMRGLDLTSILGEEEIWSALASIDSSKVADPDGFSTDFYKKSWKIIKDDIIKVVQGFFRGLDLPNYFKSSNITLIPKSSSAISWDLFRPINLTNVLSKMISKVILNRLQPLLPKLICENQWLRNNSQSVFINGKSHGFFTSSRGIKQGDPLPVTIFIIAFDYFSKMLNQLMVSSPHTLYSHRSNIVVNHLAFVDDVIIFAKTTKPAVKLVLQCLEKFQKCSGMQFHTKKFFLVFGKQVKPEIKNWTTDISRFKASSLPLKYLGTLLVKGKTRQVQFDDCITKIQDKLNYWANSFLSNGGRVTLLKSVLTALPFYISQVSIMKKSTQLTLERLFNRFLWAGQRKQMHWTSWQKLCRSTSAGGLGFKSLIQISQINFCKLWLMFRAQSSLWAKFLKGNYCREMHPSLVNKRLGDSRAWTNVLKVRSQAKNLFIWKIGEGKLNILLDNWTGEGLINISSIPQFNLAAQVAELWFNGVVHQQALQNILDNKTLQMVMKSSIEKNKTLQKAMKSGIDRESKDILIVKKKVSQSLSAANSNCHFPQHRAVDIGALIVHNAQNIDRSGKAIGLGYPIIIFTLCEQSGAEFGRNEEKLQPLEPIGKPTVHKFESFVGSRSGSSARPSTLVAGPSTSGSISLENIME